MEWIHLRLCGMLIIGAFILNISAIEIEHEEDFRHFSLYSFTSQGESWERAYNACYSEGLQLAVLDKQDQDLLDTWQGLKKENGDHAWIAGRRLEESGWMWVNGDPHTGTALSGDTNDQCGMIQDGWLKSASCVAQGGSDSDIRPAICQTQNGQRILTSERFTSWFAARMECRSQPGRDLAQADSGQSDEDFLRDSDKANMTETERTRGVWVGVCHNCWSWVTGNQRSHQSMDYFHFAPGEGSGDGEDCLHLELGGDWALRWSDKACTSPSKYFLCANGKNTEDNRSSGPQATPGTAVGGPSTTPGTEVGGPSTTPEDPSRQVLLPAILVPSVVVVVLVIVVTVLVIRSTIATSQSRDGMG